MSGDGDRPFELDHATPGPLGPIRSLGAAVFSGAVRARRAIYALGLRRSERVSVPVISVGNLTVGGTGKTPFTIYLADRLTRRGLRVCVLSRGYGARVKAKGPVLVGDEGRLLVDAFEAGDEPVLTATKTKAAVVVSPDRVAGARFAIDKVGVDVILLDDGFQHWKLERDLDVLMVDGARPFGNGKLMPAGSLREPPEAARRADLVVVNRGSGAWRAGPELRGVPGGAAQVQIAVTPTTVGPLLGGFRQPAATIEGKKVALIAAIARPERFEKTVAALGPSDVVHSVFLRDHAWMEPEAMERFITESRRRGADFMLTTEKDGARLSHYPSAAGLWTLAVEPILLAGEDALEAALEGALAGVEHR